VAFMQGNARLSSIRNHIIPEKVSECIEFLYVSIEAVTGLDRLGSHLGRFRTSQVMETCYILNGALETA